MFAFDLVAIPLLLVAAFMVYRIAKLTQNRGFLLCFGTFFVIAVIRRTVGAVHGFESELDETLLLINVVLQVLGFYLIWKNIEKLVGAFRRGH